MRCITVVLYYVLTFLYNVYPAFAQPRNLIVNFAKEVDACEQVSKLNPECWRVIRCHRWHAAVSSMCGKSKDDLLEELDLLPERIIQK